MPDSRAHRGLLGAEYELGLAGVAVGLVLNVNPPGAELAVWFAQEFADIAIDEVNGYLHVVHRDCVQFVSFMGVVRYVQRS